MNFLFWDIFCVLYFLRIHATLDMEISYVHFLLIHGLGLPHYIILIFKSSTWWGCFLPFSFCGFLWIVHSLIMCVLMRLLWDISLFFSHIPKVFDFIQCLKFLCSQNFIHWIYMRWFPPLIFAIFYKDVSFKILFDYKFVGRDLWVEGGVPLRMVEFMTMKWDMLILQWLNPFKLCVAQACRV